MEQWSILYCTVLYCKFKQYGEEALLESRFNIHYQHNGPDHTFTTASLSAHFQGSDQTFTANSYLGDDRNLVSTHKLLELCPVSTALILDLDFQTHEKLNREVCYLLCFQHANR
jgi:hypothetical protein